MTSYSGPCEIVTAERSVPGTALLAAETGRWYGRLSSDVVDWYEIQQRDEPLMLRFPNDETATVTIVGYTYLQPRHARVVGTGPIPWVTTPNDATKDLPIVVEPIVVEPIVVDPVVCDEPLA